MHGQFVEFFFVLTNIPSVLCHLFSESVEGIGDKCMWVGCGKFASLLGCKVDELLVDGAGYLAALAENHAPHRVVHHHEATLALSHGQQVHQGDVLHIL